MIPNKIGGSLHYTVAPCKTLDWVRLFNDINNKLFNNSISV